MPEEQTIQRIGDIEFKVIYSRRRTLGISILPDASVTVRVPFRTSGRTIQRIVEEKASWIIKHRDNYRKSDNITTGKSYINGSVHLFRGNEYVLKINKAQKPYIAFNGNTIEMGFDPEGSEAEIKKLLYKVYKDEAKMYLPLVFNRVLETHTDQLFKPTGLVIRSMKRRWGSCSNRGKITLSTELIKLADIYIEYVIIHELCHLKHHNHGSKYYMLLGELFPEWKKVRKEMRGYVR